MLQKIASPHRVLFLVPDLALGGVERVSLNLLRHLPQELFKCDLFTCGNSTVMQSEVPPHVSHFPGVDSNLRMREAFPKLVKKLRSRISAYDTVVATSPNTTALMHIACVGKRIRKLSWVHFNAESFMPRTSTLVRATAKAAYALTDELVFVSEGVKESFYRTFGSRTSSHVIYNIFDKSAYNKPSLLASEIASLRRTGKPVLGCVSRLVEHKGLPELVSIHQELLNQGFDHHLALIGDGHLKEKLLAEVRAKGLESSFHILGADPSPLDAMRLCDLLLLTSEHEAWPTVILEAFYAQTPIVAYDCPSGPAEMLTGSLSACLVKDRLAPAFAVGVSKVLAHKPLLAQAGLERLSAFTGEQIVPAWAPLLTGKRK